MAKIVLGLGTSHSPQLSVRAKQWSLMREKDEHDPRMDYQGLLKLAKRGISDELTQDKMQERDEACQKAISALGQMLEQARPDVVVIFGDDQHEQFHDENMPTFAIYHGKSIPVVKRSGRKVPPWKAAEEEGWTETIGEYPNNSELAEHLIQALAEDEFDITRCNRLREEVGVGHAFSFLYRRVCPGSSLPMVPVMVNTYYPPNQPTPKRCYALGQAVRKAIESWDGDRRVVVMASGGLSHTIIDEELDQFTIDALTNQDREKLYRLPREKLRGGTSEILNWVALAGVMEQSPMKLIDYIPTYRSPAGTGCGMAFSYWMGPGVLG